MFTTYSTCYLCLLPPNTPEQTNMTISKKYIMAAPGIKRRKMSNTEDINTDIVKNKRYDSTEHGIETA